jgi:hypothetical protein
MSTKIWYEDPARWFTADNFFQVVPHDSMNLAGKLNAVTRLCIYVGVSLALLMRDSRYVFIGIVALFFTAAANEYDKAKRRDSEKFLEERDLDVVDAAVCSRTTVDNPFMNPTIADLVDRPDRPKACNTTHPAVRAAVDRNFYARLIRPTDDLWNNQSSQREFYTVPSTTIPNDRGGFASWVYGRGPTCKEGNGTQCYRNMWRNLKGH